MAEPCVFCEIIAGRAPARFVRPPAHHLAVVAFEPLNPVTPGHALFVPKRHVTHAGTDAFTTAQVVQFAAAWGAHEGRDFNLITSAGRAATQSIAHLHIHYVPRAADDGLMVPWGTAWGENPQDPHRCRPLAAIEAQVADVLALHKPDRPELEWASCTECTHGCGVGDVDWPCPTVEALGVTRG